MSLARPWALAAACLLAGAAQAGSLQSCSSEPSLDAGAQSVLLQASLALKSELEQHGQGVALIARSGLALSWFGMRYSHAGLALKHSPESPWAVRQLYFACDEGHPRLFDQGLTGFLMGTLEPERGFLSVLLLPAEAAAPLEALALDNRQALALLDGQYSANAHVWGQEYQNCNQWLAELIATAWGALPMPPGLIAEPKAVRAAAQAWLREQGYRGDLFELPARPFTWLTAFSPWLNRDDHPEADLAEARFEVSMPAAIERFVQRRVPGAARLELCHTRERIVIRRDGPPLADDCTAAEGDKLIALR